MIVVRILVIEDNHDIHEILTHLFEKEHQVYSAYSGIEGLAVFERERPDLVLLDIMLPGKNGDQVLREIRSIDTHVPVVMLTALGEKALVSQYLLNGANDYIVKPFNLDEVFARITVQLRSQNATIEEEHLGFKDIRLLPNTFEVACGDDVVRLSKKEYQILQLLIRFPKKIFTKEDLFESVWEEEYLPGDNTLNTHLSNLRKKLVQLNPNEEYIETIWGLGVRLKEG